MKLLLLSWCILLSCGCQEMKEDYTDTYEIIDIKLKDNTRCVVLNPGGFGSGIDCDWEGIR